MSELTLDDIRPCFNGLIPIALATCSADGVPNITYMSRSHPVDANHLAISNQFMSKSSRNLAENPYADMLMFDPSDLSEYRIALRWERMDKRGPIFERMRNDIALIASIQHMEDVFKLKAADIFEVLSIESLPRNSSVPAETAASFGEGPSHLGLGELCMRISRSGDLDSLVTLTLEGMASLLGYEHSTFMLVDEAGTGLFTLASHGFDDEGVGSEGVVGEGVAGMAAARCAPILVNNVRQVNRYTEVIRSESSGDVAPGRVIATPQLKDCGSRLSVPAMALGQLVGVLSLEDARNGAYTESDIGVLVTIASLLASAVETLRTDLIVPSNETATSQSVAPVEREVAVKFFDADGSVFIDGDYLIKGVAGRIMWALLNQYQSGKRTVFSNRELRLDPSLDLPDFRDNFESRLILLKRRLDEKESFVRIEKLGRGRFQLLVDAEVKLDV